MSEYQYFEFRAIDRSLTENEMALLRRASSRAVISPTSFVNEYNYGDFRGDANGWMERYFDAFLHVANWGTQVLQLRLPAASLPLAEARTYELGVGSMARKKGAHVVLQFDSERDDGDDWVDEDDASGWLASLIPLRDGLASGDRRALYLGWLARAQDEPDETLREPPVPPGLGKLNPALTELSWLLRIDRSWLAVAAKASAPLALERPTTRDVRARIAKLSDADKTRWLTRLATEDPAAVRAALTAKLRARVTSKSAPVAVGERRTIGALRAAAEARSARSD